MVDVREQNNAQEGLIYLTAASLGGRAHGTTAKWLAAKDRIRSTFEALKDWTLEWSHLDDAVATFTDSTSSACDASLMALAKNVDIFVHTSSAHPTMRNSVRSVAATSSYLQGYDAEVGVLELAPYSEHDANAFVQALAGQMKSLVGKRCGLLLLEHVTSLDGLRLPLKRIVPAIRNECPNLRIVVDGAQASGLWPQEAAGLDAYVGCFHKFVASDPATGFLAISRSASPNLPSHLKAIASLQIDMENLPTIDPVKWERTHSILESKHGSQATENYRNLVAQFNSNLDAGLFPFFTTLGKCDSSFRSHINTVEFGSVARAESAQIMLASKNFVVDVLGSKLRISLGKDGTPHWATEIGFAIKEYLSRCLAA